MYQRLPWVEAHDNWPSRKEHLEIRCEICYACSLVSYLHSVGPDLDPNCLQRLSTDNNFRHRWSLTRVKFTLILETYYLSFNNKQDPYINTSLALIVLYTVILCTTLLHNFCPINLQDFSNFLHALSRLKQSCKPHGSWSAGFQEKLIWLYTVFLKQDIWRFSMIQHLMNHHHIYVRINNFFWA